VKNFSCVQLNVANSFHTFKMQLLLPLLYKKQEFIVFDGLKFMLKFKNYS